MVLSEDEDPVLSDVEVEEDVNDVQERIASAFISAILAYTSSPHYTF